MRRGGLVQRGAVGFHLQSFEARTSSASRPPTLHELRRDKEGLGVAGMPHLQSFDALTSSASRRPSPRKLRENRVSENTQPGKTSSHQNSSIFSAPSLIRAPHELMGGCTPRPRKLRNASSSITAGTVSVA